MTAELGLLYGGDAIAAYPAFVLGLDLLVACTATLLEWRAWRLADAVSNVPWFDDWLALAVAASVASPGLPDLAFRVGNPNTLDVVLGTVLSSPLLEAARRAMGWPPPIIAIVFMAYALAVRFRGCSTPATPGRSWSTTSTPTSQGIYMAWRSAVATHVFHFVLFSACWPRASGWASSSGLAPAPWPLRRRAGQGQRVPAPCSVALRQLGGERGDGGLAHHPRDDPRRLPARVRRGGGSGFSTGGQITPPVLGAAAFLMIEFLAVPYQTIIVAAIVPAFMHFYGVFMQVQLQPAKRYGLRGLTEEMPAARELAAHAGRDAHSAGVAADRPCW